MDDLRSINIEAQEYLAILALEGGNDEIIEHYRGMSMYFNGYYEAVMSRKQYNVEIDVAEAFRMLRDAMVIKYNGLDKMLSFFRRIK